MTKTDVTALECCFPGCERPRASGVLCAAHREALDREEARRRRQGVLTAMGVCKGCAGPIGAPNPARDARYCVRCWEEAEALHQMSCDARLHREARRMAREGRRRRMDTQDRQDRQDRQDAMDGQTAREWPTESTRLAVEGGAPLRWWERTEAVRWGYAVALLLLLAFAWRVVG